MRLAPLFSDGGRTSVVKLLWRVIHSLCLIYESWGFTEVYVNLDSASQALTQLISFVSIA